jgi:hypothetical protein
MFIVSNGAIVDVGTTADLDMDAVRKALNSIPMQAVINRAGTRVIALMVPEDLTDPDGDDVIALLNSSNEASSGNALVGRLLGAASTRSWKTTSQSEAAHDDLKGVNIWKLVYNASGDVKDAIALGVDARDTSDSVVAGTPGAIGGTANPGAVVRNVASGSAWTVGVGVHLNDGTTAPIDIDVLVYQAEGVGNGPYTYAPRELSDVTNGDHVWIFDTRGKDAVGIGTVIIFRIEN